MSSDNNTITTLSTNIKGMLQTLRESSDKNENALLCKKKVFQKSKPFNMVLS